MGKSFTELTNVELNLISHALYQTYSSFNVPKEKRAENYNDLPNELQRRINDELKYRKSKECLTNV